MLIAALAAPLAGLPTSQTAPISITDCFLQADLTRPMVMATPANGQRPGASGNGNWRGALTLRNDTDRPIVVKKALVHVLDGYGKPLVDVDCDNCACTLAPRKTGAIPLQAAYNGGVSVFTFSADVTVNQDGQEQVVKLGPFAAKTSAPLQKKPPGY